MRKQRSAGVKSVPKRVSVLAPRLLQLHVLLVLFQHWLLSERFLGRRQTSTTLLRHLLYLPLPLLHTSSPLTKQSWNVRGGTPITTKQRKVFEGDDIVVFSTMPDAVLYHRKDDQDQLFLSFVYLQIMKYHVFYVELKCVIL